MTVPAAEHGAGAGAPVPADCRSRRRLALLLRLPAGSVRLWGAGDPGRSVTPWGLQEHDLHHVRQQGGAVRELAASLRAGACTGAARIERRFLTACRVGAGVRVAECRWRRWRERSVRGERGRRWCHDSNCPHVCRDRGQSAQRATDAPLPEGGGEQRQTGEGEPDLAADPAQLRQQRCGQCRGKVGCDLSQRHGAQPGAGREQAGGSQEQRNQQRAETAAHEACMPEEPGAGEQREPRTAGVPRRQTRTGRGCGRWRPATRSA